jgi:hypothetical protein
MRGFSVLREPHMLGLKVSNSLMVYVPTFPAGYLRNNEYFKLDSRLTMVASSN